MRRSYIASKLISSWHYAQIHGMQHINRLKERCYMISSMNTSKPFGRVPHPFTENFQKTLETGIVQHNEGYRWLTYGQHSTEWKKS